MENKYIKYINLGDPIAVLGFIDSVLGSVDLWRGNLGFNVAVISVLSLLSILFLMISFACFWCYINFRLIGSVLFIFYFLLLSCYSFPIPFTNPLVLLFLSLPL